MDECFMAGKAIKHLLEIDLKPRDIMTRRLSRTRWSFIALGGSTNAVLHLLAMAHACGIELTLDDFQAVSDRVPFIADLKPSGKYVMEDVHKIGGTPAVLKVRPSAPASPRGIHRTPRTRFSHRKNVMKLMDSPSAALGRCR